VNGLNTESQLVLDIAGGKIALYPHRGVMMCERGRGKQSHGRYAEVAAVLVGDILVGALGAAADIQMPEVFEIVFSTGTGRQCRNTDVMGG